ncbi:YadA-like family protein [Pseudochrobactrum kiredjianiae]|uniref:YadA-like family protein n=1 Tax=Pseudochrobactrum kiredjianiae TaxID=386305 RepID=A0ABW3V003_9HYPH
MVKQSSNPLRHIYENYLHKHLLQNANNYISISSVPSEFFELNLSGGKMALNLTSTLCATQKPKTIQKQMKLFKATIYVLGISSLLTIDTNIAFAEATNHPSAFCTRAGFGPNQGTWTCIVPTPNGGQALISGVPASSDGSSIDATVLNAWIASKLGNNATVIGDMTSSATGTNSVAIGSGASAGTNNSVALGAGSITSAVVATTGATIAGNQYNFAGSAPTGTISVGSVNNERTVTNVAAGRLSETSTDAVNGSQLHATNQALDKLDNIAVKYDTNPDGTKANSITLLGGDPNKPVVISNVAAGVKDTDAVNVSQLKGIVDTTITQNYAYIDNSVKNAVNVSKNYTDQKFSELNTSIEGVRDDANRAAAIGLAAASLRYDDNPGKWSVAAGGGLWRSQSAFAFGAGYTNEDSDIRANVSATTSGGHWGVGAGLSFTLN